MIMKKYRCLSLVMAAVMFFLFPCAVFADDTEVSSDPPQLIAGLNYFNMTRSVDVIIIDAAAAQLRTCGRSMTKEWQEQLRRPLFLLYPR